MLREIEPVRQIAGEPFRRWFRDETIDLIVWYAGDRKVNGFQLCYRDGHLERALTWRRESGFTHDKVDDGEDAGHKMTPILVKDGMFPKKEVLLMFRDASRNIEQDLADFVVRKLETYPT